MRGSRNREKIRLRGTLKQHWVIDTSLYTSIVSYGTASWLCALWSIREPMTASASSYPRRSSKRRPWPELIWKTKTWVFRYFVHDIFSKKDLDIWWIFDIGYLISLKHLEIHLYHRYSDEWWLLDTSLANVHVVHDGYFLHDGLTIMRWIISWTTLW